MKKILLILFALLPLISFSQNSEALRKQAMQFYNEGKFNESLKTFDKIKDKELLQNTNIGVWKEHIASILNHNFSEKYSISDKDTLNIKVRVQTVNIVSEGVFNRKTNSYVIAPIYDWILALCDDKFNFFVVIKNNQQALLDKTGKIVIPFKNQKITTSEDYFTYHNGLQGTLEYFIVTDLDKNSKTQETISIYDLNCKLIFECSSAILYKNNLLLAKKDGRWKFINLKNNEVLVDSIDSYEEMYPNYAEEKESQYFILHIGNHLSIYRPQTNQLIKDVFDSYTKESQDENILSEIIFCKENFIEPKEVPLKDKNKYLIVKKDSKAGVYNFSKFEYHTEPIYDSISNMGNTFLKGKDSNLFFPEPVVEQKEFSKYYIFITKNKNKFGARLLDGKMLLDNEYDEIKSFSSNIYYKDVLFYRIKNKWGFTILNNKKIEKPQYDFVCIDYSKAQDLHIATYRNKKKTLYKLNGELYRDLKDNNPKEYVSSQNPIDGMNDSYTDRQLFKQNNKYGIADVDGNEILKAQYSYIVRANKNIFLAGNDIKDSKSLEGLLDINGKEVLPIKYESITIYPSPNYNEKREESLVFEVKNKDNNYSLYNSKGQSIYPFVIQDIIERLIIRNDSIKTYYYIISEKVNHQNITYFDNGRQIYDYKISLLKIQGDTLTKVLDNCNNIRTDIHNIILGYQDKLGRYGLYNLQNGKDSGAILARYTNPQHDQKFIFANTADEKQVFFDTDLNMHQIPYPIVSYKNKFFIYKDKDLYGAINDKLEIAKFKYPVVDYYYQNDKERNQVSENQKIIFSLFKFKTDAKSDKYGIVDFDGKVLMPADNKYDEIIFPFENHNSVWCNKAKRDVILEYVNKIFICKTKDKVDILGPENKKIVSFIVPANWKFDFSDITVNHHLILRDGNTIKLLNLKTQKIDLETIATKFSDDIDGGYSDRQYDDKNHSVKMIKYSKYGRLIFEDSKTMEYYDRNYDPFLRTTLFIVKRNNKYGVIDANESILIPFVNDSLYTPDNINFIAKRGTKYGVLTNKNQMLHEFVYDAIKDIDFNKRSMEQRKVLVVTKNKKKGILDFLSGRVIIPIEQDDLNFSETEGIQGRKNKTRTMYGRYGEKQFSIECDTLYREKNLPYWCYTFIKDGKKGRIDYYGNLIDNDRNPYEITPANQENDKTKSENNKDYDDYKILERTNFAIVSKGQKQGVVDLSNSIIISLIYDDIRYIKKGYFECKQGKKAVLVTPQNKVFYEIKNNDNN
ncbi:WG repeat-containing protein [Flavobacterium sp. LS1R49]|uniref:WG repeat-containing protein n=1 Tax=Flavobacterium shii TaxID=2987687 RepID=A0A9X2ZFI1_9FLAO|nr:WG repeat-containing protein [Flavobacterium shii]MCV9927617.1 WG repeat-containing protein [Flavobacterium shii]